MAALKLAQASLIIDAALQEARRLAFAPMARADSKSVTSVLAGAVSMG